MNECEASEEKARSGDEQNHVLLRQVMAMIQTMQEGFKETALLIWAEGLSHQEAAYVLGIKESTVSWRIHTMRKKLTEMMNGEVSS